jgi:ribonuclease HI
MRNEQMQLHCVEPTEVHLTAAGWIPRHGRDPTGWGCVLRSQDTSKQFAGTLSTKSEARSELFGIVSGLSQLKWPCTVNVYTANDYLFDCGQRALRGKKSDSFVSNVFNDIAKNSDLFKSLQAAGKVHTIRMCWVRARSRHQEAAIARNAARSASSAGRLKAQPSQVAAS